MSVHLYKGGFLLRVTDCGADALLWSVEQQMKSPALLAWREAFSEEERKSIVVLAILNAVDMTNVVESVVSRFDHSVDEIFEKVEG